TLSRFATYGLPRASRAVTWWRPKTSISLPVQTLATPPSSGTIGALGSVCQAPVECDAADAAATGATARRQKRSSRSRFMGVLRVVVHGRSTEAAKARLSDG